MDFGFWNGRDQCFGFRGADAADDVVGGDFGAVIEDQGGGPILAGDDLADTALHPPLTAGRPIFFEQHPDDYPDSFKGPPNPSRYRALNMITNCPKSMSCSVALP